MIAVPFHYLSDQARLVVLEAEMPGAGLFSVLLDTGNAAPFALLLSPGVARAAGACEDSATPVIIKGAVGAAPIVIQPINVPELKLGPMTLRDLAAGSSDAVDRVSATVGRSVGGILGYTFLREQGRVTVDYGRRLVEFDVQEPGRARAIPFVLAPEKPLILVDVTLNAVGPFAFALDTGAGGTVLSLDAAHRSDVRIRGSAQLSGAGGRHPASFGEVALLGVGPVRRPKLTVVISDALGKVGEAAGTQLDGVLGADIWGAGKLTLDYGQSTIWIEDASPEPAGSRAG